MPFYPALPEYKPAVQRPFTSLIAGLGAAQEFQKGQADTAIKREALQERQQQVAAQKTYAETGDPKALLAAAPDLFMKLRASDQESVSKGLEEIQARSRYWNPDNYPAERAEITKRNPHLANILPPPERMQTPEQIKAFEDRNNQIALSVFQRKGEIEKSTELKYQQDLFRTVKTPEDRLKFDYQSKLLGVKYDFDKSLQENAQTFQGAQKDKDRALMEQTRKDTVVANRQHTVATAYGHEQTEMMKGLERALIKANELGGPEGDKMAEEAKAFYANLSNERLESYWRPFAKEMGVTLPPPMKVAPKVGGGDAAKALEILRARGAIK